MDKELWATVEDLHAQNKGLQDQLAAMKQQLGRKASRDSACVPHVSTADAAFAWHL